MKQITKTGTALLLMCAVAHANGKEVVDVRGTRPIEIHSEAGGTAPTKTMPPAEFKSNCLSTPQKVLKEQTDPSRGPYMQINCQNETVWVRAFQMQLQADGVGKVKCIEIVDSDSRKRQKITETGGGRGLGSGVCGDK